MKLLRHFTLAIAFILFSNISKAQWVNIPDYDFGNYLDNAGGCGACMQLDSVTSLFKMDTTCPAVTSKIKMNCSNAYIQDLTGIQYFDNLDTLICVNNFLTWLPPLPKNLRTLNCSHQKSGLPFTITSLPQSLKVLGCVSCQLTTLPTTLPSGLLQMECENNALNILPALPSTLRQLSCGYNSLVALPLLPGSLELLECSGNFITTLPMLPPQLKSLYCEGTQITTLPQLPTNLHTLLIDGNQLTSIPPLPGSIRNLSCSDNAISYLPKLPDYMYLLDISGSNITCLPELKHIEDFRFLNTNITCLPNYPSGNISSNPALASVPLCNYFNNNGCAVYWNITGNAYEDIDGNCIQNTNESGITNVKADLWQNGALLKQTIPTDGLYSLDVNIYGTYQITIDTSNIPFRVKCPAGGSLTSIISAADSMDYSMDFALECKPGYDLEARSIASSNVFRPANNTYVEVAAGDATNFYNAHCAAGTSGSVSLAFTGPVKFTAPVSGALTPTITGNTLTYTIADFGTVNFAEDFDVVMQTDTFAQIGQQVCFTLTVNPIAGDNNPANNTFSICYTVVNSFDPNDKQAYPAGNIDTLQEELTYTVRFQNTGNAEAQHIYITDTLSSSINPASFQLLAYSHQPMVQLDGNKLRFNFPNINLPDSTTNEPASHGYVQFKVKLNNGLPVGTIINNTAFIYFDFNAPVITNTTVNTIYVPQPPVIKPVSIGKYRIERAVKPNGKL